MNFSRIVLAGLTVLLAATAFSQEAPRQRQQARGGIGNVANLFKEYCAVCHGERLEGAAQGTPLIGVDLVHGAEIAQRV